ncbi:MAG: histidine kinase dimerization/phospho-acceptor domain-containing protein, partial [Gemmatimonadota bacterium]
MSRSLRFRLAARTAVGMTAALAAISLAALFGARAFLDRGLDASLMNMASIQAAAVTDAPSGEMHFHEWDLTPEEAARVRELNRYAEVWSTAGESLLRSQYITENLPLDTAALRSAAAGGIVLREQRFQGFPIRSLYYPLERMGEAHARHVLQVAAPLTGRNRMLTRLAWLLLAITLLAGAGSFVGGWWLARRVVRPVHEIIDQAEAIGAGTLGQRIHADADSREYERLIRVLNSMLARLEASFEAQRRFTADASHELRSPLTALRGEIELALRRERDGEEYRRVLESNLEEVDRLARLADDLLTLARADTGVMRPRLQALDAGIYGLSNHLLET